MLYRHALLAVLSCTLASAASLLQAQNRDWDTGNGFWGNPLNWSSVDVSDTVSETATLGIHQRVNRAAVRYPMLTHSQF